MVKMAVGAGTDANANPGLKRRAGPGPVTGVAPAMLATPTLSGSGLVGAALRVDPGVWGGVPAPAVTLRWRRDGVDVPGASAPDYVPVAADDGADLRCVVTAANASGSASAVTEAVRITGAAPVATGAIADRVLDQGEGAVTIDASAAFTGAALVFGATGAGASVDPATGILSVPDDTPRAGETITVTATNSGGSASVSFTVTVITAPVLTAPASLSAPSLTGPGRVGAPMQVETGTWSGDPTPAVTLRWRRNGADIPGAAGAEYVPALVDEGIDLDCVVTAVNVAGSAEAATTPVRIVHAAPSARAPLPDAVFDQGGGTASLPTAQAFAGEDITFGVTGGGAAIDPATGWISLGTDLPRAAETVTVTATNSGGSASISFIVMVTTLVVDTTAPVVAVGAIDVAASPATLSVTIGEAGTAFWMVDGAAMRGAAEVEAGGGAAGGDFAVTAGTSAADLDLDAVGAGDWTLHLMVRDAAGNRSDVVSTAFTLEAAVEPPVSLAAPTVSGAAVVGSVLSGTDGAWAGEDLTYSRAWERGGTAIPGETGATYTVAAADAGFVITRRVTAANGGGSASRTSASVGPIMAASTADHFTISPTGPYFVDPANVPANTTRIEFETKMRLANLPGSGGLPAFVTQEATGFDLKLEALSGGTAWQWHMRVRDGAGVNVLYQAIDDTSIPEPGEWFTVRVDANMAVGFEHVKFHVNGSLVVTVPFTTAVSDRWFQTSREVAFFATTSGGNLVASGGVDAVDCEYARVWFTTGGTRTLRKELSGNAATVNADAWLKGDPAT